MATSERLQRRVLRRVMRGMALAQIASDMHIPVAEVQRITRLRSRPVIAPLPEGAVLLRTEDAVIHRAFDCSRYDRCIDYAAARGWDTFCCSGCPHAEGQHLRRIARTPWADEDEEAPDGR